MRRITRAGIGGTAAALLLALVPTTATADTTSVSTADELQAALDAAGDSPGRDTIEITSDIELSTPATFDGATPVQLVGPGSLIGTDPDQDVLVLTTSSRVDLDDLKITGGRRGVVVVVPQDADGRIRLDINGVTVSGTGYHGVQMIDGLVDLDESGGGTGLVPADQDLPSEALVESEVVGGAPAMLIVTGRDLEVVDSGRGALDQDGLRVDERGDGSIVARFTDSAFVRNGADGFELDESGDGSVLGFVSGTTVVDNGDFDVSADPDDGIDVDEAGPGDLSVWFRDGAINGNVDQGLDLDEEDEGDATVTVSDSDLSGNVGENLKVTELGDGDVRSLVGGDVLLDDSSDDDGVQLEEFDEGIIRGRINQSSITGNDSQGLELISLDISEGEFEDLDDADLPLPTDGETGRLNVCGTVFGDNGDGPVDDIDSVGVAVRCGVDVPAFSGYTLSVLHVNDGESDLLASDDDEDPGAGTISRFGDLLLERRAGLESGDRAGVVTITSGDNFLASPELEASFAAGVPWFDSIAYDYLDFDAFTIGNHEFDFGPAGLAAFIAGFEDCTEAPFLSANLVFDGEPALAALEDAGCLADSTVVEQDGRQIGIIGLTTPDLRSVSSPGEVEVLQDLAAIANAEAQRLTDEGVDIVLLASHLQAITNEVELAAQLSDVDAIIGGGGGEELEDALEATTADGRTIPIVTVPGDYFDVGELRLQFDDDGELVDYGWDLRDVTSDQDQDAFLLENVEEPVAAFVAQLDQIAIATSEVGLNGVRAEVRSRETNTGNLLTDSFVRVAQENAAAFGVALDGPLVGLTNGGGIRNDSIIGPGEITLLDTFDIAPFGNFVSITEDVAPADLVTIVERGLSGLPDTAGSFAQWSGLVVEYDGGAAAGSRIVNLTVNGIPYVVGGTLQDGLAPVDIASQNFLASGGDGYEVLGSYEFTLLGQTYQQSLAGQIAIADLSAGSVEYGPRDAAGARTRIIPFG